MYLEALRQWKNGIAQFRARHAAALEWSRDVAGSLLLHGLVVLLVLFLIVRHETQSTQKQAPFVPIDVVQLGDTTTAPPAPNHAPTPQQKAMHGPASAPKPRAYSSKGTEAPRDELEVQLKNLSKLSQPNSDLKIENGASDDVATSSGADAGAAAVYSVRDYIRAQILRRWVFDFSTLGNHNVSIPLRVSLTGHGTVITAEIVDHQRYVNDRIYREVALSARNAVLLSAPFKLPNGMPKQGMDFVLNLNPRDTLR